MKKNVSLVSLVTPENKSMSIYDFLAQLIDLPTQGERSEKVKNVCIYCFLLSCVFVLLLRFSCAACDIYALIMWSLTFVLGQFGQVSIKHHLVHCKLPGLDSSQTKVARLMLLQ